MIFTQHVDFQKNDLICKEFDKICREHPACKGCPLREEDIELCGNLVTCITGRMKGNKNND